MTTIPLTIALVCSDWGAHPTGISTLEEDVLRAALTVPSRHRFVVYPDNKVLRAIVSETSGAGRVTFVRSVRKIRIHRRVWRRAKRLIRRKGRQAFNAKLNDALVAAGADCAWMLGGAMHAIDLPYVATVRDIEHRRLPWFPEVIARGAWRQRDLEYQEFIGRAAAVIVGTNAGAVQLRGAYGEPAGGAHIVPLPTPSFAMEASERPRKPRTSDLPSRYLLYPAPFVAHRNHLAALRVLEAMASMAAQPALVLVGADGGTKERVMREAAVLGVESRVIAYESVDRDRLVALYQHAEALIHPSLGGAASLTVLEAMALGCPVIAADVPGADEQIGDAGILVDPHDPQQYVAAIRSLRHDPYRREGLVERGMNRARGWSAPQYAAAVLALIDSRVAPVRALWA